MRSLRLQCSQSLFCTRSLRRLRVAGKNGSVSLGVNASQDTQEVLLARSRSGDIRDLQGISRRYEEMARTIEDHHNLELKRCALAAWLVSVHRSASLCIMSGLWSL